MTQVFIGLGSNMEDPVSQLRSAISALKLLPDCEYAGNSSFYVSKPVGPQNQPDFINAVAELYTRLDAVDLLEYLQNIENRQGRERNTERWGPRTLDLDIILYGDMIIADKKLTIPHKEIQRRNFVLYPLYEIAPDIVVPGLGHIKQLLNDVDATGLSKLDT